MNAITVEQALQGDRQALAEVVRGLQDVWYRFSLSQLRDAELAADAAQETAMRFLRDLDRYDRKCKIETWSLGIALNVCRELRRKKWRQPTNDIGDFEDHIPSAETNNSAELREESGTLHDLLKQLPERQREALVLRYFEDLSVEESAQAMQCAAGTVKATVFAAIRALRGRLKDSASE